MREHRWEVTLQMEVPDSVNTAPTLPHLFNFQCGFPLRKHVFSTILETQDVLRCFTMQTHSKDTHANGDAGLPTHERMARFICKWRSTTQKPRREFPPGLSALRHINKKLIFCCSSSPGTRLRQRTRPRCRSHLVCFRR